jgi:hypothetical protein
LYLVRGDAGFEAGSLRQGDILKRIPFPLLDHSKMRVLGVISQALDYEEGPPRITPDTHEQGNDRHWVTIQVPARFGFFVVTSHCCELEPRHGRVRTGMVTLARMRPIPNDTRNNAENFNSLRANKDSSDPNDPGYKDLFYLEPHALIDGTDWSVHFNQIVTLPTSDIELLLARKVLQMNDRTRAKFKTKLAYSLGKYTDEEIAAGLDEPWVEAAAPAADAPAENPAAAEPPLNPEV